MAMGIEEGRRLTVADRLRQLLTRRGTGAEAAQLGTFARLLAARGTGYLDTLADEDAAALVESAFRFYVGPGPVVRVRAITPTYATDGWDAPGSIIETCIPDRPFVVDTIRERLAAAGLTEVRALLHPVLTVRRDATGRVEFLAPPEEPGGHESFVHVAVPPLADPARLARLVEDIRGDLEDVRLVTDDFATMVARAQAVAGQLDVLGRGTPQAQVAAEATVVADFLRWLVDGAFVFLGYREYGIVARDGVELLATRPGTGLGLLRREMRSSFAVPRPLAEVSDAVRARLAPGRLLTVTKTLAVSPVHRRARMDDIGVKELDADGRVTGERRFVGLFTSKAYAEEAAEIPLLRRLLRQILTAEQVVPGGHDYKEIVAIFNALPKWELFASTAAEVGEQIRTILAAAVSDDVVVAVRRPAASQRVSVLVVLPRARFSGAARARIQEVLAARLGATLLDYQLVLGEGDRALLHFAFAAGPDAGAAPTDEELRAVIGGIVCTWEEQLEDALVERLGEDDGRRLARRWAPALPGDYKAVVTVARAAADVVRLDAATGARTTQVVLDGGDPGRATTALCFYVPEAPPVLSECMPMLEHLGLRALAEDQVTVAPAGGPPVCIQTFFVQDRAGQPLDVATVAPRLTEALLALRAGRVESDPLNHLVLEAGLSWQEVDCLRAYCGYAAQLGLAARPVVLATVAAHPESARLLFASFAARFRPAGAGEGPEAVRQRFVASLDGVQDLREDLLLRALADLVEATVRTNAFTRAADRDHVAFKIRSTDLQHVPPPRPLYEIFVHSPGMEGIHLRAGRIARGGLRYSDRPEDFRTEVLGLMKTQTVKNAVIVPMGAKGGFVLKGRREPAAVVAAYRTLIRGLLDLTDNLVAGRVVHPPELVIYDEEDPYLVVAADKGTAAFSDVANAIAAEYGFWLGDAFASGGSHGYDHKRLGITARGAWECVRTHCVELGLDADTAPLTVAGVGDMGGDVFGNGLLRSPHLRLRAAFNHRHVFLDPEPDPGASFAERERLYRAAQGWDAYDRAVLSPGGAVVERAAKKVTLAPEARALLGLGEEAVSGEHLVQAVLRLDVDLLFNGGIGTYVGAAGETDAEIRDAVNDRVRVKAGALRARMVAEGGNLGFTQRARIEYALAGGRINTDAIDNSAGVDMSDHEVNLKIGLQSAVESGALAPAARNALLEELTDDVAARVLAHNRAQSRVLGLDHARSRTRLEDFRELMGELERSAGLDRALEALPDRDALRARRGTFLGLTRPELAVLMAYAKIHIQRELLASAVPDDPLLAPFLAGYFPAPLAARFPEAVRAHPLRREIIATTVANAVVDTLGATFVYRVTRDTGATVGEVVRAWAVAWAVAGGAELVAAVAASARGADVEASCQLVLERTAERVTKWILANTDPARPAAEVVAELAPAVARVRGRLAEWIAGAEAEAFQRVVAELEMAGLPGALAHDLASAGWLTGALDAVTVAGEADVDAETAAACYYGLGQQLDFAWLWSRLDEAGAEDRWQRRAVEGLVDDLLRARRQLTSVVLWKTGSVLPVRPLVAVQELVRDLRTAPRASLPALTVVVRAIRRLAESVARGHGSRGE
jgi:glutamate dehydrogenase